MTTLECDALVIGSGPGGSTTASALAAAGKKVLLLEEGPDLPLTSARAYTLEEMNQKYRNSGLTPSFGRTRITYLEGRCLGGASEINAALYHRPLPEVLDQWTQKYHLDDFGSTAFAPWVDKIEREFSVSYRPDGAGEASDRLQEGAKKLGWKCSEIARFWRYQQSENGTWSGARQSMTETLIPRCRTLNVDVRAGCRVKKLIFRGQRAISAQVETQTGIISVQFRDVFVCAGALQTALLLRRSGVCKGIGNTLTMNPMIRIAARFNQPINDPSIGVPVHQIEAFKPKMTLGCSHASPAHLALWLAGQKSARHHLEKWDHLAMYYVKISGESRGYVRNLVGLPGAGKDALVHYPVSAHDLHALGTGLDRLGEALFAAGAVEIFNPLPNQPSITRAADLQFAGKIPPGNSLLSAIHLHSTVPMGGPADSYGKLHGYPNLYVNDSSLLPDTPGINPQGTILALARRNIEHFLDSTILSS